MSMNMLLFVYTYIMLTHEDVGYSVRSHLPLCVPAGMRQGPRRIRTSTWHQEFMVRHREGAQATESLGATAHACSLACSSQLRPPHLLPARALKPTRHACSPLPLLDWPASKKRQKAGAGRPIGHVLSPWRDSGSNNMQIPSRHMQCHRSMGPPDTDHGSIPAPLALAKPAWEGGTLIEANAELLGR